jgi:ribosome-associated translation inhibitor RaiA
MGDMYNYDDYPTDVELRCKTFDYSLVFEPVAESGDFRIDVPKQLMEELKEQHQASVDNRVQTAISSAWDRVKTQIESMKDKLAIEMDDDGKNKDGKTVRYHDTFVQNATDLCDLLAHLNVTNDPRLDQARIDLKNAIQGVSVETLKIPTNHATRNEVKTKLDDILSKYAL